MSDGPNHWSSNRYRVLDASAQTLAIEMVRAIGGLLGAFCGVWWASAALGLRHGIGGFAATTAIFVVTALSTLLFTSGRPIQKALAAQRRAIASQETELRAAASGHQWTADLQDALEMAEEEMDVLPVIRRALDLAGAGPSELLLADSSRAHLRRAVTAGQGEQPGCSVATPWSCPAVRRGRTLEFATNRELATCPHLRDRPEEVSALCVPVTILGTPMGVVHLTAPPGKISDSRRRERVESVALQGGARIGMLRAMSTSQLAAATDPLTGQLNRRSLEDELRRLELEHRPYAVAFADLDRFKALNDTHGHAAGDRALRHFATVAASIVRAGDLVCRYGGEEFILVFVGCDVTEAAPVVHRLRSALKESILAAGVPAFTVSVGLADSSYASEVSEVIACADAALLTAKREGRDQLIVASPPTRSPAVASPAAGAPEAPDRGRADVREKDPSLT